MTPPFWGMPVTTERLTAADRTRSWIVTGPLGRLVAFVIDFGAVLWAGVMKR